jgi:hypothetical protein
MLGFLPELAISHVMPWYSANETNFWFCAYTNEMAWLPTIIACQISIPSINSTFVQFRDRVEMYLLFLLLMDLKLHYLIGASPVLASKIEPNVAFGEVDSANFAAFEV